MFTRNWRRTLQMQTRNKTQRPQRRRDTEKANSKRDLLLCVSVSLWPLCLFLFSLTLVQAVRAASDLPTDWIDPDTGHRVVRLSREDGSASLYFHQNAYTPDGKKLI